MNYREQYDSETTWHGKVIVMEIYHLIKFHQEKKWTLAKTAEYFEVSIGLVSENLRLAFAIHSNEDILKNEYRQDALRQLVTGRRNVRNMETD